MSEEKKLIEGTKCRVTGEELITHCRTQAAFHKKRWDEYKETFRTFQASRSAKLDETGTLEDSSERISVSNIKGVVNDRDLETQIRKHSHGSKYFSFLAEHLDTKEIYLLSIHDLTEIELIQPKHSW